MAGTLNIGQLVHELREGRFVAAVRTRGAAGAGNCCLDSNILLPVERHHFADRFSSSNPACQKIRELTSSRRAKV